jgi:hypothetical protein
MGFDAGLLQTKSDWMTANEKQIPVSLLSTALWFAVFTWLLPTIVSAQIFVEAWVQRYDGPAGDVDEATAVAVTSGGNVIVTGFSRATGGFDDFATISYSSAGVPIWTNLYNGPENYVDTPAAVAVDNGGNVFVAGYSLSSNGVNSYVTIAYSGAGLPLWTNRYAGLADSGGSATAMAVDTNGNVFVTGFAAGSSSTGYGTIAYSGAGVPLWTNLYAGSGNGGEAHAVAVGGGRVIVTGASVGNSNFFDFATVAYSNSSTGELLWTNHYDGPGNNADGALAMAVDSIGNVFVTGFSRGTNGYDDYATIGYSGTGVPLWTNRYHGPITNSYDQATAVAVDSIGNAFVTGISDDTNGTAYATIAYSGAGMPLWTNRYNGPGAGSVAAAVAVDGSNNVIVTGYSYGTNGTADYATIAYSGAGVSLWTNRYNGPIDLDDQPKTKSSLAIAPDGSIYVTGGSVGSANTFPDFATVKYEPGVVLNFQTTGDQIVLSWIHPEFVLQSSPLATGTYTNVDGATSPYTNVVTDISKFFRLQSN